MFKKLAILLMAMIMLVGTSVGAWAQERLALIVGNSKYQTLSTLNNPSWDAQAIGSLLKSAGFDVTTALDLGQVDMRRTVRDFAAKLTAKGPDSVALVYFAGHGLQIDGQNYLVPVDANIKTASDVPLEAIRLADIMNLLNETPSKTRMVILDACRNDPFEAIKDKIGSGLAIVNAPAGTVVAYSTSPGNVAYDGETTFSPFTKAFIEAAAEPGAGVSTVFQNARLAVHKATDGLQTPWEVTALTEPFQFFPGSAKEPVSQKSQDVWRDDLRTRSPQEAYELVVRENNVTIYQIFLTLFPRSQFSEQIQIIVDRRIEMLAWYEAVSLNTFAAYESFLDRYPTSDLALTAQRLMERAGSRSIASQKLLSELSTDRGLKDADDPGVDPTPAVKEVVKIKTVYKTRTVVKIKKVKVPVVKYKTKIKYKTRTIVKKIKVPVVKYRTVVKHIKVPVIRYRTVIKRVPTKCRCKRSRKRNTHTLQ